jgi:hypothetical protein
MEVRAAGAADAARGGALLDLLAALSGQEPAPIEVLEMFLLAPAPAGSRAPRRELHLRRLRAPADPAAAAADGAPPPEAWTAAQYAEPPWGDTALAALPATVRTAARARCAGPDVPSFWRALGFEPAYALLKTGHTADVDMDGAALRVLVSRVRRAGAADGAPGEELAPGELLVEAWGEAAEGRHGEAAAATAELARSLRPAGVELGRLPRAQWGRRDLPPRA